MNLNWIKIDWSNSNQDVINRPTEILAFRNLDKYSKCIRNYGINPRFTDFEKRILDLDFKIQLEIIPISERQLLAGIKVRKPIVIYEIANLTNHTASFIQKTFDVIEQKIELGEYLKIK